MLSLFLFSQNSKNNLFIFIYLGRAGPGCHLTGIHGSSSTELARPVHVSAVEVVTDSGGHRVNLNNISHNQLKISGRQQAGPLNVRDHLRDSDVADASSLKLKL